MLYFRNVSAFKVVTHINLTQILQQWHQGGQWCLQVKREAGKFQVISHQEISRTELCFPPPASLLLFQSRPLQIYGYRWWHSRKWSRFTALQKWCQSDSLQRQGASAWLAPLLLSVSQLRLELVLNDALVLTSMSRRGGCSCFAVNWFGDGVME